MGEVFEFEICSFQRVLHFLSGPELAALSATTFNINLWMKEVMNKVLLSIEGHNDS